MPSSGTHVCARCSDNFIVNTKFVACKFCDGKYHLHCVSVKDQICKAINDCRNLFWICDGCLPSIQEKLDVNRRLEKLEKQTEECKENTTHLLKNLGNTNVNPQEDKQTWSGVVRKNIGQPLIIKPKNVNQNSATTKNAVTQKICPSEISVEVSKLKPAGQGSVIVQCRDGDSLKKLQNKILEELSDSYEVEIPKPIRPKIIIVGIQEEYIQSEVFLNRIKGQSCLNNVDVDIKIVRKYIPNNKRLHNVILETSADVFGCLISSKRVFIDWNSYPVYEYVGVLRCYKCWRYGHRAVHCREEKDICPLCNKNHKSNECNSTTHECTNCKFAHDVLKIPNIQFNHTVFDKDCICHKKEQEKQKNRTHYS